MMVFTVKASRRNITVEAANGAAALSLARRVLKRGEVFISCFLGFQGGAA
ncbi:MAG: hypothetical protein LBR23_01910 [Spirochaetaceae bacterium]|nr:hypothetical protein [Spirochaetaceae bacterium]